MAQVPVIQDQLNLINPGAQLRTEATGDAFGAAQARALGRVQQGLEAVARVAEEKDVEFDEADALRLDAQLAARQRDRLYNPESGYLSTARGQTALDRRGEVEAGLQADIEELAGGARSPRAQAAFRDVASRRTRGALDQMAVHLSNETARYRSEQVEAQIGQASDNLAAMIATGDTPQAAIDAQISTIIGYVDEEATRGGWSPERRTQAIETAQSASYINAIQQAAAVNPARAREIYDRFSPSLDADDRLTAQTVMERAEREMQDARVDAAWVAVSEGRTPDMTGLPGRDRIAIQDYRRRRAEEGREPPINREMVTDLGVMAASNPNAFMNMDLRPMRGQLGEAAYGRYAQAQAELRNGGVASDIDGAFTSVQRAAQQILGFDLTSTVGARDSASNINRALYAEVERFSANNPGVALDQEATRLIVARAVSSARSASRAVNTVAGALPAFDAPRFNVAADFVDAEAANVTASYSRIPTRTRTQIEEGLRQRNGGRDPTPGEVVEVYRAAGGR